MDLITVTLKGPADRAGWRDAARRLDALEVAPEDVVWRVEGEGADLFAGPLPRAGFELMPAAATSARRMIPRELNECLNEMLLHADAERFALGYRLLRRTAAEPKLFEVASDPDVARAVAMAKSVRRDAHKMKAFVRFRRVEREDGTEAYVAWFEPDHHVLEATAPFFVRRFATMRWSILTPSASAHWDGEQLTIGAGAGRRDAPADDQLEAFWRTYYASIFNPARLKVKAMRAEMPKKYWRNLPEAELIGPLVRGAQSRAQEMIMAQTTPARPRRAEPDSRVAAPVDDAPLSSLADLRAALDGCRRCPLYADATQGVPGEGGDAVEIMFIGEQPGDQEDLAGRPFVGPAGRLFDVALERVGIPRDAAYVTNAVKHFKFEPRGKRRIHKKPGASEIEACKWWLKSEIRLVRPRLIVALGATAAYSVTGRTVGVQEERGVIRSASEWLPNPKRMAWAPELAREPAMMLTVHPSFLLRLQEEDQKRVEWRAFLRDLETAREHVLEAAGR